MHIEEPNPSLALQPLLRQAKTSCTLQRTCTILSDPASKKVLPNLIRLKKYASRLKVIEPYHAIPQDKKHLSFSCTNQLSHKRCIEAEIVLDQINDLNNVDLLADRFKRLRTATKITVKLNGYSRVDLSAVKRLFWSLANLKSLTTLFIHISYHSKYNDKEFMSLWRPFAKNKHLKSIDLSIYVNYGIKSSILGRMHDLLDRIKTLENIDIKLVLHEYNYKYKPLLVNKELQNRLESPNMGKKALRFDVPFLLERKELLNILDRISRFNELRSLALNFTSFAERVDGDMLKYILQIMSSSNQIVQLDLSFEVCWFLSEVHILELIKAIERLQSLVAIRLNFGACFELTDKTLYHLAKRITQLPCLEHITLNFYSCYQINDLGASFLISSLAKVKTLRHLDLNFANCYKLTSEVTKHLTQYNALQSLLLSFEGCCLMTETTMLFLTKTLGKFSTLEVLHLNLNYLCQVTNYEMCALGTALRSLSKLKRLSLDFIGYKGLTDIAFTNFFRNLAPLKELNYLSINLRYVTQITDRAISILAIIVCGLEMLREFKLDLLGVTTLTEKCYPKLVSMFSRFEESKKAEISI